MADSDNKYYRKRKLAGWIKRPFWIHKDDIDDIASYIDSKANRRKLISDVDKLPSAKGEK